jgi:glutamate-1-semialdehyde 2,1-aminomutase
MQSLDPGLEGKPEFVAQVGTLNGNPVAAAAGLATLAELRKPGAYERLFGIGSAIRDGLAALVREAGVPAQVIGEPPLFDVVFTDRPILDYRAMLTGDRALLRSFNQECLKRGILKGSQKLYVSLAHTEADVAATLEAFRGALSTLRRTGQS